MAISDGRKQRDNVCFGIENKTLAHFIMVLEGNIGDRGDRVSPDPFRELMGTCHTALNNFVESCVCILENSTMMLG
jgi:hypothetical protein